MRDYQIIDGYVRYIKFHEFQNHTKTHNTPHSHGRLYCNRLLGEILGWVWKHTGYKLTRD